MSLRKALAVAGIVAVLGVRLPVHAHDTWLEPVARQPSADLLALRLGSGNRYPKFESGVTGDRVVDAGCVDKQGGMRALQPRTESADVLELRSRVARAEAGACWVQLMPVDLTLTPDLVKVYLDEIRAPQAVRAAQAAQARAGKGWSEVYRKFVRIEFAGAAPAGEGRAAQRKPRGYALELVPAGPDALKAGAAADFVALADGMPVAGLAVEFVSRRSPVGVWRETDAQGRIRLALPFGGEWLVRATALDLPGADGVWRSRFATLTIEVQ